MSNANLQLAQLSQGQTFQQRVAAAIYKKALAIVEDFRANPGVNYTQDQRNRAYYLCTSGNVAQYYGPLACSTNVIASTITQNGGEWVSDISDPALDSQVYTVVFQDLV